MRNSLESVFEPTLIYFFLFLLLNKIIGPDLEATFKAMRSGKVTDEQVRSLMTVFETSGTQKS